MIITKTPYRISFFGGGTDFPIWYKDHPSSVISTTINKYSYIVLRSLPSIFDYKFRVRYYFREEAKEKKNIRHPVVRELLLRYPSITNIDLGHHGDLPARTGLGSSSSFTVGLIHSLAVLQKKKISKLTLAKESIFFEQKILKEFVGSQDQIASAYGGFNKINFFKNNFKCTKILPNNFIKELEKWCCLFYLGSQRSANEIEKEKFSFLDTSKKNILRQMTEISNSAYKVVQSKNKNNIKYFGELLRDQWLLKKNLNKSVSNSVIDDVHSFFLENKSIGGKVLGAGGGGFYLALIDPLLQKKIIKKTKLVHIPFMFENSGSSVVLDSKD